MGMVADGLLTVHAASVQSINISSCLAACWRCGWTVKVGIHEWLRGPLVNVWIEISRMVAGDVHQSIICMHLSEKFEYVLACVAMPVLSACSLQTALTFLLATTCKC